MIARQDQGPTSGTDGMQTLHLSVAGGLTPFGASIETPSLGAAVYLTSGTRHIRDVIHYPDHDLITHKNGPARAYTHADGMARTA